METTALPKRNVGWIIRLIGLKSIYQIVYLFFALIVMKSLSVADYGIYSYILALILYFSAIPLLGLPIYLQRNMARDNAIHLSYFKLATVSALLGLAIAYVILPDLGMATKSAVLLIIAYNMLTSVLVAINDGRGQYIYQYRFLFFASLWMVVILVQVIVFHHPVTLSIILRYWLVNSLCALFIAGGYFLFLYKRSLKITSSPPKTYSMVLTDLILMYSIAIPDGFAKFYDKFLASRFIDTHFLGNYSFNLMIVATAFAFFIRPINSIFVSQLAKVHDTKTAWMTPIRQYYCFALAIYGLIYLGYTQTSSYLLTTFGLSQYADTLYLFKICILNMVLYLLAFPFLTLLAISNENQKKLVYCVSSLLLFNLPLLLLVFNHTSENFLLGFVFSYLLNLLLCVAFRFNYAKTFFINTIIRRPAI